ncbi:MAG: UbiD family decarboxylase [Ignisphaera sp.]|nr:UbiD family decarboxylase [Ignisphaera sp.]MCX8167903.1 UbiD family decarboxylase [Ignisphaera sp.]MDW8085718.1 UbiD family decarboxylase [Ignisphaera sp.]
MSLREFIEVIPRDEVIDLRDVMLDAELEPSRVLLKYDRDEKVVLFKVKNSDLNCVGNVLNSRRRLYRYVLSAENEDEAYRRFLESTREQSKLKERAFEEFFTHLKEVDLYAVPFIKFFPKDGGRYLTSSIFISCLDEICNASIHRTMLLSKNCAVARIVPRHLRYIYDRYRERGRDTPIAIVVGAHPSALLLAATSPPLGVFEISLVPNLLPNFFIAYTPKYGLPIPAPAAVVMEGRITGELVDEGPFVDLLNLYDSVRREPMIVIEAIYINTDEYFHTIFPSGKEHKLLQSFSREALIWEYVGRVVPRVHRVRLLEAAGSWLHAVISIEKNSDGDAKNAILAAFSAHPSLKMVTVVDPDIDVDSEYMIEWAFATRFRGRDSILVIEKTRCSTLDPVSPDGVCDKVGFDLTIPMASNKEKFLYASLG